MSRHESELTDAQWVYRPVITRSESLAERGAQTDSQSARFCRDLVGVTQWGPLERSAGSVSLPQYLLAPLTRLGRAGCLAKGLARAAQTTG